MTKEEINKIEVLARIGVIPAMIRYYKKEYYRYRAKRIILPQNKLLQK